MIAQHHDFEDSLSWDMDPYEQLDLALTLARSALDRLRLRSGGAVRHRPRLSRPASAEKTGGEMAG
ncbi:MAG: hypothetical protein RLY93_07165 [Sumerlaeia bacterium]